MGQDRDSVFCEEGGEWTVDKLWLEEGDQGTWACKGKEIKFEGCPADKSPAKFMKLEFWGIMRPLF